MHLATDNSSQTIETNLDADLNSEYQLVYKHVKLKHRCFYVALIDVWGVFDSRILKRDFQPDCTSQSMPPDMLNYLSKHLAYNI